MEFETKREAAEYWVLGFTRIPVDVARKTVVCQRIYGFSGDHATRGWR